MASSSSQCSTTGVTKAVVCAILSAEMVHIKGSLLLVAKGSLCRCGSGFPLSLSGPLLYVRRHISVK